MTRSGHRDVGLDGMGAGTGLIVVVALLSLALLPVPAAAATGGIDCGCGRTGAYVRPRSGAAMAIRADGYSPGGTYRVTATTGGSGNASLTVRRVATGEVVLSGVGGAQWGFSPDEDRFVVQFLTGSSPNIVHTTAIYDLTTTPARPVRPALATRSQARVLFSPSGRYVFYTSIQDPTFASLLLFDAQTGDTIFQTSFRFQADLTPADPYGVTTWGWSPADERFLYAYATDPGGVQWHVLNLERGIADQAPSRSLRGVGRWEFSPCGDVVALAWNSDQVVQRVDLYSTADGSPRAGREFLLAPLLLSTTASEHVVTQGGVSHVIATNTATDACPGTGGGGGGGANVPPTAAFTAPGSAFTRIPVAFTDGSTDPDGRIGRWEWTFGDGTTSTEQDPLHTFTSAGTFNVRLRVTDDGGATDTAQRSIVVEENMPPRADFTVSPASPVARDIVTLTDVSTDDDGIAGRWWSLDVPADRVVSFKVCETIEVTLNVFDNAFQQAQVTKTIVVGPPPSSVIHVPAGGSLADAVASACPGDTIQLEAGTYAGGVRLLTDDLTVRGTGMAQTLISGGAAETGHWVIVSQPARDRTTTLADLTVTGGEAGLVGCCHLDGGGVLTKGRGLTRLDRVGVTDNHGAAGIRAEGDLEIESSRILRNRRDMDVQLGFGGGAGINVDCCPRVTVRNSEIAYNQAPGNDDGGGLGNFEGEVTLIGNSIHHNSAGRSGGGLYLAGDDVALNNVILENAAPTGAGVFMQGGPRFAGNLVARNTGGGIVDGLVFRAHSIVNSTIVDNDGPGLVTDDAAPAVAATVVNSIIAGNTMDIEGTAASLVSSLVGVRPLFVDDRYHLGGDPQAVDAGDNTFVPADLTTDADGDPRVLAGLPAGAPTVDIGYDEYLAGVNTPVGSPVVVPLPPVTVTYDDVTAAGTTTVTMTTLGMAPPSRFRLGDPPIHLDITTTATFAGSVRVCIEYAPDAFAGSEEDLRLFHGEGAAWQDVTVLPVDIDDNVICGSVTSLSPFAIVEPDRSDIVPPTVSASLSTPANGAGWHNAAVTVVFTAADEAGGSGVADIVVAAAGAQPIAPTSIAGGMATLVVTAEGVTDISYQARDRAGNLGAPRALTIRLDRTRPTVAFGTPVPPPNGNGWNKSDVSFTFLASDGLSGVAHTAPSGSALVIVGEGTGLTATVEIADLAGNRAFVTSPPVHIDRTAPELFMEFDPASRHLLVFGRDALSGVPGGPVAPLSVGPLPLWSWHENEDARLPNVTVERRVYDVVDRAGNRLRAEAKMLDGGRATAGRLRWLEYEGASRVTLPFNLHAATWTVGPGGSLRDVIQRSHGPAHLATARFDGRTNQTSILRLRPLPIARTTRAGLASLRIATAQGGLALEY